MEVQLQFTEAGQLKTRMPAAAIKQVIRTVTVTTAVICFLIRVLWPWVLLPCCNHRRQENEDYLLFTVTV